MKIDFEYLGGIEKGSIQLNDFTLFCGKNNSGKTYVMYSLYGLLDNRFKISFDFVKPIVKTLKQEGSYCLDIAEVIAEHKEEMIQYIEERFKDYLPILFGVTDSEFLNTKIQLHFSDEEIQEQIKYGRAFSSVWRLGESASGERLQLSMKANNGKLQLTLDNAEIADNLLQLRISESLIRNIFFGLFSNHPFLLPAERAGINLFFKELFSIRNLLLQQAQNDNVDPMYLLRDIIDSRYAEPVKNYMQYLNNIIIYQKDKRKNYYEYAQVLNNNVLGGKYEVDEFGNVFFLPADSKNKLPLHFSSSTVKTLFGLVFYLEHLAIQDDYLMIDEPELNLHPDNQRQVARILAQLVNAGLKVIVSTHSNYFMREINNLIMLKSDFPGVSELREKYKYQDNELLDNHRVSAYLFDNKKIEKMKLDDEGIIVKTFDTVTDALNKSSDEIYYTIQDAKEMTG